MSFPVAFKARASEQIEIIRRQRVEIRKMLDNLEMQLKALQQKRIPQVHHNSYVLQLVPTGFDISKVDPILREAAKDKSLRIRFMDCTDLAMECAYVRHMA